MAGPFEDFLLGYTEAALWSSIDEDGESLDNGDYSLSDEATKQFEKDCRDFFDANRGLIDIAVNNKGYDYGKAGHDFWLTRNHHGAGFWDRGLGNVGKKLTDMAHAYGSCDLYVGDDGEIYAS